MAGDVASRWEQSTVKLARKSETMDAVRLLPRESQYSPLHVDRPSHQEVEFVLPLSLGPPAGGQQTHAGQMEFAHYSR